MSDLVLMQHQEGLTDLINRLRARYLDCSNLTPQEAERLGEVLAVLQRDAMFALGDLVRYSEARWPDNYHQCFPEWISPGLLARNAGVCRAFPKEADRQHNCTYSQFLQVAGKPDRQKLLAEMVGLTTDETRVAKRGDGPTVPKTEPEASSLASPRWLLAIDVHYYLNTFYHSGAGVEAATQVSSWITRTVERLKEKGLTDVACCFDSPTNHRKELTKDWEREHQYKGNRGPKEPELITQLQVVRSLLEKAGFSCFTAEGYEADDCIASYAKTFAGKVAILSGDKDMKQCLSGERVVILTDVTWDEDDTSGQMLPTYHWYTEKKHSRIACKNLWEDTFLKKGDEFVPPGLTPRQFIELQCLMGDPSDQIKGAIGIGDQGALRLIHEFGTVDRAIQAAHADNPDDSPWKPHTGLRGGKGWKHAETGAVKRGETRPDDRSSTWEILRAFEPKLEITRALVTLRTDLTVPNATRIG